MGEAGQGGSSGDFALLTDKQAAVLALLVDGRTTKEMAAALAVSESAINRRIELLRTRLGGITRLELARRYREWAASPGQANATGVENSRQNLHLANGLAGGEPAIEDVPAGGLAHGTAIEGSIASKTRRAGEPRVVPGVLDGHHALLVRLAVIAFMLLSIVASLVLGLAAAQALTEAVS